MFGMGSTLVTVFAVIAAILAIGATVVAFILLLPEKKRPKLNKFLGTVADILNFKHLFVEKILKAIYVFATAFAIIFGFLMLFSFVRYDYWGYSGVHWYGYQGLIIMIGGPIVIRIVYEILMMFILLVKNTIEINKKLSAANAAPCESTDAPAPAAEPAPEPEPEPAPEPEPLYRYCTVCGTRYDANKGGCPNGCKH